MSVLHGCAQKAGEGEGGSGSPPAPNAAPGSASSRHRCPECAQVFKPVHVRQLFCSPDHKAAFHNRATVRGRALVPVAMASRITRDGCAGDKDTGRAARRESRRLMDAWAREDREAGRMNMVDYIRARSRIGY